MYIEIKHILIECLELDKVNIIHLQLFDLILKATFFLAKNY